MFVTGAFYVATGSVGIGTVSPSQLFEVVGGEIKAGRVDSSLEGGQVSFGRSTDNATAWYIDSYGNSSSTQLRFVNVSNAVVAMTITGSNVGIGTSSPTNKLTISNNGDAVVAFRINDTNANASFLSLNASNTDSAIIAGGTSAIPFDIYTGGSVRLRVTSGGDMQIQGTNSNAKVTLFRNYSNNQPGISVYNTSNSEILYFNGNNSELGIAGGVSYGQSLKPTAAVNSGYYTIDSAANILTLGANGAVNIGGFSGMVLVTNTANGVTMLFLCGGGGSTLVSQSIGGAAGTMTNWLGSGYTFTTAYTSTANYSFQIFRTRVIA
jgi:hypothetical protein